MKVNLKNFSLKDIEDYLKESGKEKYRASQIMRWMYKYNIYNIDGMTNISKKVRDELHQKTYIEKINKLCEKLDEEDGTKKILFGLNDGERIESVIIPDKDRITVCVSSQVGCKLKCSFCNTAKIGFIRNLTLSEITEQILQCREIIEKKNAQLTNIVFMGMGEPMFNIDNVLTAADIISSTYGLNLAQRKITISTAGIVPGIQRLEHTEKNYSLAVSLNATTDEVRDKLMPVNKKYNLKVLLETVYNYSKKKPKLPPTFEYVMLKNVNDTDADLKNLLKIGKKIRCKINLIQFNDTLNSGFTASSNERLDYFFHELNNKKIRCIIRKSKGRNISGACGQLAADYIYV